MGWLNQEEREKVRRKFHLRTAPFYLCDVCDKPLPPGEPPVVDPRRGYHHRPRKVSIFCQREPRYTVCLSCDRRRRDHIRHKRERKQRRFLRLISKLFSKIKHKPKKGYWTKEKCIEKLHSRQALRAIRVLVKEGSIKKRHGSYLPK